MHNINLKFLSLFFYLLFGSPLFNIFVNARTISDIKGEATFNSTRNNQFRLNKNQSLKILLKNNLLNLDNKLVNLVLENTESNKEGIGVEIVSEKQYELGNRFYAEGNVEVFLNNGKLKADLLIYDKEQNNIIIDGNIFYFKGNQYLEASYFKYSFNEDKGYIKNVYGVLDLFTFNEDIGFDFEDQIKVENNDLDSDEISDLKYLNRSNIGFENTFENENKFNITDLNFEVPQIKKWRFKSDQIKIDNDALYSDEIFFTNDPFNKPQFFLKSKKFSAKIVKDKLRLISKNTRINLDNKFSFPIGRRSIVDKDSISRWTIGADYEDKDGFYISRALNNRKLFSRYDLKITPYLLIQRALKGNTNSFVENDSSILSNKVTQDISFADFFAINTSLNGPIKSWNFFLNLDLDSLNFDKFSNASRGLITFNKSIDLNANKTLGFKDEKNFTNNLNFQFYGAYRQKITRSFTGDEEIYFGKGFTLSNNKSWISEKSKSNLSINYDIGEFEAKEKNINNLKTLFRNVFTASYENQLSLWNKKNLDPQIDISYKYSPKVIKQGLSWISSIKSGFYFYGDDSQQKGVSFSSGPKLILGSFKNKTLDYTNLYISANYIFKDGESPFAFDDIDKTTKIKFNLEQQILGPLLFSFESFLNLDSNSNDYAKFTQNIYGLDIKRRAYSIGAFYKESTKAFGIQFNINNFNFLGRGSKF